ncbi:MAG: hypothetical protein RSB70_02655 [Clostridium sp.]
MIYLNCGVKGSGKTKILVDLANSKVKEAKGNMVFIDVNHNIARALSGKLRFIDLKEFNVNNLSRLYGTISGVIAKDYDVESIFIDGLLKSTVETLEESESFFKDLEKLSGNFNVNMYINISSARDSIPNFLKGYKFI